MDPLAAAEHMLALSSKAFLAPASSPLTHFCMASPWRPRPKEKVSGGRRERAEGAAANGELIREFNVLRYVVISESERPPETQTKCETYVDRVNVGKANLTERQHLQQRQERSEPGQ